MSKVRVSKIDTYLTVNLMRVLVILIHVFIFLQHPLRAQETVQSYAFLNVARDLPDKRIQAIVQDEKGFVWIATFNGLFRYDGLRYKVFRNLPGPGERISFNHIRTMYIHHHRFLVIEGDRQVNIVDLDTEKMIFESPVQLLFKQSLSYNDQLYFQFEDTDFKVSLFTLNQEGTLDKLPFSLPPAIRMEMATLDHRGDIWFFDKKGWIWKSNPHEGSLVVFDSITYRGRRLLFLPELFTDKEGHIWAFDNAHTDFNGVHMIDGPKPIKYGELLNHHVYFPQPDYDKFWIFNTRTKLLSELNLRHKTITPILTLPAYVSNIRSIMKDSQQNLWIGSHFINPNGILLVHPHINAFQKILFQNEEQHGLGLACRGLTELPDGNVLIGSYNGIYTWSPVTDQALPLPIESSSLGVNLVNIWKIIPQPERNQLWFTKEENGIFKYSYATKKVVNFIWKGDVSNRALGMVMDDKGLIWMGTRSGVSFFDTHTESYVAGPDHLKQFYGINGYDWLQSHPDELWFCSSNGLYTFDRPTKTATNRYAINTKPYLYSNEVFDIVKDGQSYWIGTDNGLHKLEGDSIVRYTTEQGLAHDVIADLLLDDQDNLWVATFHGLSKMNTLTGEFQNFYVEDGLPHNEFNRSGKLKSSKGRLYFSSQNGVLHFNPAEVIKEVPAYELVLTGFSTFNDDGVLERWPVETLTSSKQIQIPANNKFFQVEFALLNFINSEDNRYTYYLEGLEDTWRPLTTLPLIQFNNLPPGTYTLHIRAVSPSGHQSKNTLDLKMIVQQHFYQTNVFKLIVLLFLFGSLYGILRNRFLQGLRMERMRNRISSDLHDEVGGVLSGIAMQMDLLEVRSPDHLKPFMQRIAESSRSAVMKMRDVIWSLDSSKDQVQDLVDRMKSYTLEALAPFGIAHRFEMINLNPDQKLDVDVRQNFYLIFKEAMNNIIKHAKATAVEICLEEKKNEIIMTITDNGIGFSKPDVVKGQGLLNMEKRSKRIGGRIEFIRGEKGGTTISLYKPK